MKGNVTAKTDLIQRILVLLVREMFCVFFFRTKTESCMNEKNIQTDSIMPNEKIKRQNQQFIVLMHALILLVTVPRNGAWGEWSSWTVCDKGCGTGKRKRHRFCDNPFPLHGGKDCPGHRQETEDCNTENCPGMFN